MSEKDGGPAFPRNLVAGAGGNVVLGAADSADVPPGMSLRDWFAGQVLCGMIAGKIKFSLTDNDNTDDLMAIQARHAYMMASAMLNERTKDEEFSDMDIPATDRQDDGVA